MFVTGCREFRAARFFGIIRRCGRNRFKEALRLAVVLVAGLGVVSAAYGGPYSKLYIFGDSLSDIGNIASATFGSDPGPYYWNNRFSNGPVWVEDLDTGFGLPPLRVQHIVGRNRLCLRGRPDQRNGRTGRDFYQRRGRTDQSTTS